MTALARAQAQLIRRVLRGETHYDVLDLPANSTTDVIKAARDDLARSIHEQRGPRLLRLDYPPRAPKEDELILGILPHARYV